MILQLKVLEAGPDLSDELEEVMREQRNSTVLRGLLGALELDTLRGSPAEAEMLFGLPRAAVNADLARLLSSLLDTAEGGTANIVGALDAATIFDGAWRQLGLDVLDALFIRWRASQVWPSPADVDKTALEAAGLALPPGADVTRTLASAIDVADETIDLRIRAKNEKLREITAQAVAYSVGGKTPKTRIELQGGGSQVMVVMETPGGTEIASVLQMDSAEVASLVETLNPASDTDTETEKAGEHGEDSDDIEVL